MKARQHEIEDEQVVFDRPAREERILAVVALIHRKSWAIPESRSDVLCHLRSSSTTRTRILDYCCPTTTIINVPGLAFGRDPEQPAPTPPSADRPMRMRIDAHGAGTLGVVIVCSRSSLPAF